MGAAPNPGNMRPPKKAAPSTARPAPQPIRATPAASRPPQPKTPAKAQPPRDPAAASLPPKFVNPYTFVLLPEAIVRGAPVGHRAAGPQNLSGSLSVRLTARSRILTRGGPDGGPPLRGGVPIIPGSALHGALRSMHETLCGGCLRVFDRDFVPVYRDAVTKDVMGGWKLAVVASISADGRPLKLIVCSKTAVAKHNVLPGADARSGMRLKTAAVVPSDNKRQGMEVWKSVQVDAAADGDWVLLLSDGSARQEQEVGPKEARTKETRYYAVFGKVTGGSSAEGPSDTVWDLFKRKANDARDVDEALRRFEGTRTAKMEQLRTAELADPQLPYATASFTDPRGNEVEVGRRIATRPWLRVGQPVWVQVDGQSRVTDLKISMVWRHLGKSATKDRVPPSLLACEQWDDLCPSCQMFGSADTTGRDDDEAATQQAYRGHVRVGDLTPEGLLPTGLERLHLAPLSAPRPGSGQFYLETGNWKLPTGEDLALREWGSAADKPRPRRLRGRKRYWPTSDPKVRSLPRWQKREGQSDELCSWGSAFPEGTVLTGTVTFDNLRPAQLGSLIASLDPRRVLSDQPGIDGGELVFTIGGGRPFGFGACTVDVEIERIDTAGSRWGEEEPVTLTAADLIAAFLGESALPKQTWPQLAASCQFNRVDPDLVWYPPGERWAEVGRDSFDEGFEFWQKSEGRELAAETRPLTALPDAAASAAKQQLPIVVGRKK